MAERGPKVDTGAQSDKVRSEAPTWDKWEKELTERRRPAWTKLDKQHCGRQSEVSSTNLGEGGQGGEGVDGRAAGGANLAERGPKSTKVDTGAQGDKVRSAAPTWSRLARVRASGLCASDRGRRANLAERGPNLTKRGMSAVGDKVRSAAPTW